MAAGRTVVASFLAPTNIELLYIAGCGWPDYRVNADLTKQES
jgi:hypothetical protein